MNSIYIYINVVSLYNIKKKLQHNNIFILFIFMKNISLE